jgi:hypothetical protein
MRFGYTILRLLCILFVLVCVLLATKRILETFDGTSSCDPKNVVALIRGQPFCFPPGITNVPQTSYVNDGANQVDIILPPNTTATLYTAPDRKGRVLVTLPDPAAPKHGNTTTATYSNLVFGSIDVTSPVPAVSSGSGFSSRVSSGSVAGYLSGTSSPIYNPSLEYIQGSSMLAGCDYQNQSQGPNRSQGANAMYTQPLGSDDCSDCC